jgi:hypothetical protein
MVLPSGRALLVLILGVLGSAAVACSAADSSKAPLAVCNVDDPKCPSVASAKKQPHADVAADPVPTVSPEPAPEAKPSPEAGTDAAPVLGKECLALSACCDSLAASGYDTTMCKSVLSTNNEDACYTKHASFVEFGDCL